MFSKNIVIKYYNSNGEWSLALIENVALSLMIIGVQNLYILYTHNSLYSFLNLD